MEPNLIIIPTQGTPPRYNVPRHFLDQAVGRKLQQSKEDEDD
jgi:hypothetical protein